MNHKLLLVLLLLSLVAAAFVILYKTRVSNPTPATTSNPVENQKTIAITAQNGVFTPATYTIKLFDTLTLNVTAQDQGYYFKVQGYPRLDTQLPKGQTTPIKIESLGLGEYPFICGPTCTGKIVVEQLTDIE